MAVDEGDVPLIGNKVPAVIDLKALFAAKPPGAFIVVFYDGDQQRQLKFTAWNVTSLYGQLLAVFPPAGIMQFWILNAEGTEILAEASLSDISQALDGAIKLRQRMIGFQQMIAQQGAEEQRRMASAMAAMRNGGR